MSRWLTDRAGPDLGDPRLRGRLVPAVVAAGVPQPVDFSRAFRATHGTPPGDYPRQVLVAGRTDATMVTR
jgi:hypothetical protein